jgi:RNA recognition motif-containing protein
MTFEAASNKYLDSKIGFFQKDPSVSTLYVGNLSFDKTEVEIKDLFEQHGQVKYVKIVKDRETHQSRGIAFIQMPNRTHAQLAISKMNGVSIDGRSLKVSVAIENDTSRVQETKKSKRRKPYKAYISKADRAAALETK